VLKLDRARTSLLVGALALVAVAGAQARPGANTAAREQRAGQTSAIYEIASGGSARRLVGGVGALGFALSKNGSRLAFYRGEQNRASIWLVNRDGSGERELVAENAGDPILTEFPLAWSPAGDRIAYTAIDLAGCVPGYPCNQTRVVIADARDGRRIREIVGAESLQWLPGRRGMVWACDLQPDPYGEREGLCFTLSERGAVHRVNVGLAHRPLPAPDGVRVAFTDNGGGGARVLHVLRRSVRGVADPESAVDGALSWSPDGRRLAFGTAAGELFTVPAAGGRLRRVGRIRGAATPVWGPGGRRLAFARARLWTARPDGSGARRVSSHLLAGACVVDSFTAGSCGPAWSPDGRKLYYLGSR
jgi:dipeptidyl aminopeptidase/acylaminoacyl peptidase